MHKSNTVIQLHTLYMKLFSGAGQKNLDDVADYRDSCLGTSTGVKVTPNGCPVPTTTGLLEKEREARQTIELVDLFSFFMLSTSGTGDFPSWDRGAYPQSPIKL